MAQAIDHHQLLIFQAQQEIFNKLCIAYRRSNQGSAFRILAEELRRELAISEAIFARAVESFVDANGERIVDVVERNGERYLKLRNDPIQPERLKETHT